MGPYGDEVRRFFSSSDVPGKAKKPYMKWFMAKAYFLYSFDIVGKYFGLTIELFVLLLSAFVLGPVLEINADYVRDVTNYPYLYMYFRTGMLWGTVAALILAFCYLWYRFGFQEAQNYASIFIWISQTYILVTWLLNVSWDGIWGAAALYLSMGAFYLFYFVVALHYVLFLVRKVTLSLYGWAMQTR